MIPNGFDSPCEVCKKIVKAGEGFLVAGPWRALCLKHIPAADQKKLIAVVSSRLEVWRGSRMAPYQERGALWLSAQRSAILADEQGLGKTVQAICAIPRGSRSLVICPAIAKQVWMAHIKELRPDLKPTVVYGRKSAIPFEESGAVVIMNYDIIPFNFARRAYGGMPSTIIADEVQYLKNESANRTINVRTLCWDAMKAGGRVYFLSGTPIKNTPDDLWSLLTILKLGGDTFGSHRNFRTLMGGKKGRFGIAWDGAVDASVPIRLRKVMLRRHKADVLPELPDRRYENIFVDIPGPARKLCDEVARKLRDRDVDLDTMIEDALANDNSIDFITMARVCKALAIAKIKAVMAILDELEAAGSSAILVWDRHVDPLEAYGSRPGWRCLHGGTSENQRKDIEREFQSGELKGLAISIKAGGTALTLTRSTHSIFAGKEWSPADNEQARDRNHRIGQKNAVLYTSIVADHILDRRLNEIIDGKNHLIDATVKAAAVK